MGKSSAILDHLKKQTFGMSFWTLYVTWLLQDLPLIKCLLNISHIIEQAMNALHEMESYWKEVVGEYMKE